MKRSVLAAALSLALFANHATAEDFETFNTTTVKNLISAHQEIREQGLDTVTSTDTGEIDTVVKKYGFHNIAHFNRAQHRVGTAYGKIKLKEQIGNSGPDYEIFGASLIRSKAEDIPVVRPFVADLEALIDG